jgi:hypothetical protein
MANEKNYEFRVGCTLTEAQYSDLEAYCTRNGRRKSEVLRHFVENIERMSSVTELEEQIANLQEVVADQNHLINTNEYMGSALTPELEDLRGRLPPGIEPMEYMATRADIFPLIPDRIIDKLRTIASGLRGNAPSKIVETALKEKWASRWVWSNEDIESPTARNPFQHEQESQPTTQLP